jgi:PHP domain-containing protein
MTSRRAAPLVDLHAHTTASDGSDPPQGLVAAAAAAGIGVLAVTDHDTITAVAAAQQAGRQLGVEVLATGGSDYHGHHKPNVHLGTPAVPAQVLVTLRDRLATDGPLCVGFAQNGAKQPKGGNT